MLHCRFEFEVNFILHCCFIIPKGMFNAELNIGFKTLKADILTHTAAPGK